MAFNPETGRILDVDVKLLDTIKELDAPYNSGKIKFHKKTVSVVGKAEAGAMPTHSKEQASQKSVNRAPAQTQKDEVKTVRWKLPK